MKSTASYSALQLPPHRRELQDLLCPMDVVADRCPQFQWTAETLALPRYIYQGEQGGGETIRIGIFAAIHGDEPEGALGIARFFAELESHPHIAVGYALYFYPVCNPTGYEDGTRHSRSGRDLNREFWQRSEEPEVCILETEIRAHQFHGIINLHCDDTSDGLYGFVGGDVLSEHLLEPALKAAEQFLPRNQQPVIDGFAARRGIITDCYGGVLKSIPGVERPPFEITFETPQHAPAELQVEAFNAALRSILTGYRQFMAIAQDI